MVLSHAHIMNSRGENSAPKPDEPCGEREPPITRDLKASVVGGGPVTAVVRLLITN